MAELTYSGISVAIGSTTPALLTNCEVKVSCNLEEGQHADIGFILRAPGKVSAEISFDSMVDASSSVASAAIGTTVTCTMGLGSVYVSGSFIYDEISAKAKDPGYVEASGSLKSTGTLTYAGT